MIIHFVINWNEFDLEIMVVKNSCDKSLKDRLNMSTRWLVSISNEAVVFLWCCWCCCFVGVVLVVVAMNVLFLY